MMDNSIGIYPYSQRSGKHLGGCVFLKVESYKRLDCVVFVFNNPYRKANVDVLFYGGRLWVSDWYGESMERETLEYTIFGGFEDVQAI